MKYLPIIILGAIYLFTEFLMRTIMKVLLVILILIGLWLIYKPIETSAVDAGVVAVEGAASAPSVLENIEQWLRDHTPKK